MTIGKDILAVAYGEPDFRDRAKRISVRDQEVQEVGVGGGVDIRSRQ